MRKVVSLFLLMFCSLLFGQNRIPLNGENIIFYPLNDANSITHEGYDCFYSSEQVLAKGGYNFKPKFRFKKNKSNKTPSSEIEKYTFCVEKLETIKKKDNEFLLVFLTRNEDKEKAILRVPKFYDKKSNVITQSFVKLRFDDDAYGRKIYFYNIVLPFINADTLISLKRQYKEKEIFYGLKNYNPKDDRNHTNKELDLKDLTRKINDNFWNFDYDVSYKCSDLDFMNIFNGLIYKQLCASVQPFWGNLIKIPVTYLVGNTDLYDKRQDGVCCFFDYFFYERSEYLKKEFVRRGCIDVVNRFAEKKVYYGLNRQYKYKSDYSSKKFEGYENRVLGTNELYKIKEGVYDCLRFDVIRYYDYDYRNNAIPYAILRDSFGVEFRVPVDKTYNETEGFEEYFVLADKVDSIINKRTEIRLQEEMEEQEKIRTLTKKYGKSYADFLINRGDETIERFETLVPKYGKSNAKLMIEKRVKLGWSKDMCRESWGSPNEINTTSGSWGVHEQWVYEVSYEDYYNMSCLYFENGILTTIQD